MRAKALLIAALLYAVPAAAQPQNPSEAVPPEQLAREAIAMMIQALGAMIANLPQYAAPEMDADGNITIRRLNPPRLARPAPSAPNPQVGIPL
ncbi:MAG: hypothetical protein ACK5U4_23500 [Rhodospirillales bacterium]|jgi:hypothetical protein